MSLTEDIRNKVTAKFVAQLEAGTVPWHKPWRASRVPGFEGVLPVNVKSRKPYRGINVWLLAGEPFTSPVWGTFKQWAAIKGCKIRTGEKATMIVFFDTFKKEDPNDLDEHGRPKVKTIPSLKYYNVFNAEQVDGAEKFHAVKAAPVTEPEVEADSDWDLPQHVAASKAIESYVGRTGVTLGHGGNRACYAPGSDHVQLPPTDSFKGVAEYFSTAFHELAGHSTGHQDRCNRKDLLSLAGIGAHQHGDYSYGREELVAEIANAMTCAILGVDGTFDNSASYVSHWLENIKGDNKLVISAAQLAQKAVDCFLGTEFEA